MDRSRPFIIQVTNASALPISNVDIGDSFANRTITAGVGVGDFGTNVNITLSSGIVGVSYREWLAETEERPFKVGQTMVISRALSQTDQTATITHRDGQGDRVDHAITPTLDPNQGLSDRVIEYYEYMFDGYTRLRINQVIGNAVITIKMYPKNILKRMGRPNIYFVPPGIVKTAMVEI